jgi:hypothetical protein
MRLDKNIPDLENRMNFLGDEFGYLQDKYKNIAFNCRSWRGTPNKGKYLFATEGCLTIPRNYDIEFVKSNYRGLITPNSKFKKLHDSELDISLVNGPGYYNNFWIPEKQDFVDFDDKIHGICALNSIYYINHPSDFVQMREPLFNSITVPNFVKHSYGKTSWGGVHYKGFPNGNPSSPNNLEVVSRYKFCLCLEPMYHQLWSWDWLTERLLDCFKMKTIPLYIGCWNIEQKIPDEIYIDLRKFNNINDAVDSVKNISKDEYDKKTNMAYEFYNDCKIGNILEIEKVLESLN